MSEKNMQELLKDLQELKQENNALKSLCNNKSAENEKLSERLQSFEWTLKTKQTAAKDYVPDYGDLSLLNKDGLIKESINKDQLQDIVSEYLDLLETSAAIYEKNGDYALGIFSSGWCQMMDSASRRLCNTGDNSKALASGKWLCHDSCWKDASLKAMNEGKPAEVACNGGIHLYAVPVWANQQIIGAINFGFGSPPKDDAELKKLSKKFKIPLEEVRKHSKAYKDRPQFIIDYAKQRIQNSAKYLGYLVERKMADDRLLEIKERYRIISETTTDFAFSCLKEKSGYTIDWIAGAVKKNTGYSVDEIKAKKCWRFMVHPDDDSIFVKHVLSLEPGEESECELRIIDPKSAVRWLSVSTICLVDTEKNKHKIYGGCEDITERIQADKALKESKSSLQAVLHSTADGILAIGKDEKVLYANERFAELWRIPSDILESGDDSILLQYVLDQLSDPEGFLHKVQKLYSSDKESFDTIGFQDGRVFERLSRPLLSGSDIIGRVWSFRDVTERKQAEEGLRKSEERFQRMLALIPDMISIHDKDFNIVYSNWKGFAAVDKAKRKHYTKCYKTYRDLDEICPDCRAKEVLRTKNPFHTEAELPDGMWIDLRVIPVVDTNGEVELFAEWVRDITDQKQKEIKEKVLYEIANVTFVSEDLETMVANIKQLLNKLIDTTNFYVALYDKGNDLFSIPYEADEKDQIETWPADKSMTGLVIKKKKAVLFKKHAILGLMEAGEIEQIGTMCEVWLGVPLYSGTDITGVLAVQDYHNPNTYDKGGVEVLEYVSSQISMAVQRKKFIEELKHAKEKAEESDRLKTAFLNNMSHEIRTPLNGIIGFTGLMNEPEITPEERDYYGRIISQSGRQLIAVIDDIINMATIEAGQAKLRETETNVNQLLKDLYHQFLSKINESQVAFNYHSQIGDKQAGIMADETKLTQVLVNLIGNAIKFTERGKIEFGCKLQDSELIFQVEDSGIGITEEFHEIIFERFRQVDPGINRVAEGNGLGLAISKAYVGLMGGEIKVESEPGRGTKFVFTMPYKPLSAEDVEPALLPEPEKAIAGTAKTQTLLLVEDDYSSQMYMETILKSDNIKLITLDNGKHAVEECAKNPDIDLVLMDLKIPGIDGFEATRLIKQQRPELPIIAVTAHALSGDRDKALQAGCDDYIAKPVKKQKLFDILLKYT